MVTLNGVLDYAKMYPEFVFGTGYEKFSDKFKETWQATKGQGFSRKRIGQALKDSFEASKTHNDELIRQSGSFWKSTKKSLTSIWPDLKDSWKAAGEAASEAGKSVGWAKFKSIGKVLGKRMPLIGALLTVAVELPNIFKATKNEGLLIGAGETAKAAARLGLSTVCGAITQALIPVPFLGGMIGFVAGDMLGRFIFGKSYTEKQMAKNEQTNPNGSNIPQFDYTKMYIPYGGNSNIMSDAEFMKLQQMYNQAANPNYTYQQNPFMQMSPYMPQQNFSTLG